MVRYHKMAASFFNRIGQIGVGIALASGVVNSALYNGKLSEGPPVLVLLI